MQRIYIQRLERLVSRINAITGEGLHITGCGGNWSVCRPDGSRMYGGSFQPAKDTHFQLLAHLDRAEKAHRPDER